MVRNWNEIKWIFEPDGSLLDIYVQDVTQKDWEALIDLLNMQYELTFGEEESTQIDKEYAVRFLNDTSGKLEFKWTKIYINGICIICHFFFINQIELNISPEEIKTLEDYECIEQFMIAVSKTLKNQLILTGEGQPEFPLIKIDYDKGINIVLTRAEASAIVAQQEDLLPHSKVSTDEYNDTSFSTAFYKKALESASQPYKATAKEKNWW